MQGVLEVVGEKLEALADKVKRRKYENSENFMEATSDVYCIAVTCCGIMSAGKRKW